MASENHQHPHPVPQQQQVQVLPGTEFFNAEEGKVFAEIRLNSLLDSVGRQRDSAINSLSRVEAELSVRNAQLKSLGEKLALQVGLLAKANSDLSRANQELAQAKASVAEYEALINSSSTGADSGQSE